MLGQHRETVIDTTGLQRAAGPLLVEQRNADDGRSLERDAQPDAQITALDLSQRDVRDPDPVGQFLKRPVALAPSQPDTSA